MTVSRLWDQIRSERSDRAKAASIGYDWFILALDLLFMMGAIYFDRGLVYKRTQ